MNQILNNHPNQIKLGLEMVSDTEMIIAALNEQAAKWCAEFADGSFYVNEHNVRIINKAAKSTEWWELCLSTAHDYCYFPVSADMVKKIEKFFKNYWNLHWSQYHTRPLSGQDFSSGFRIIKNL